MFNRKFKRISADIPKRYGSGQTDMINLNDHELLFISNHDRNIWKYNISENKWTIFLTLNRTAYYPHMCYDKTNKIVYLVCGDWGQNITIINVETKKITTCIYLQYHNKPTLVIDSDVQIIGENYIWNNKMKEPKFICDNRSHFDYESIYVSKSKEIFCFGGRNYNGDTGRCDKISKYSVQSGQWIELNDVKSPSSWIHNAMIAKDQRHIILLCNKFVVDKFVDSIYIFDLLSLQILKRKINMPFNCRKKPFCSVLVENNDENDVLINGFIRMYMKKLNIDIPIVINDIIKQFRSNEYIIIRGASAYELNHMRKIHVDKILDDINVKYVNNTNNGCIDIQNKNNNAKNIKNDNERVDRINGYVNSINNHLTKANEIIDLLKHGMNEIRKENQMLKQRLSKYENI